MKAQLDCIPCFLKQSLEAARMATNNIDIQKKVMNEVQAYLQQVTFEDSPPILSKEVHHIIRTITKNNDPYNQVKQTSNKQAEKMVSSLQKQVNTSEDGLLLAIKLAIVGNVIDFGTMNRFNVQDMIKQALDKDFDAKDYPIFKETLEQSSTILYLADNAGEIYFDKLLLEKIHEMGKKITYVVKENPIINDALFEDVIDAEIDKLATIISCDRNQRTSAPGVVLSFASDEFKQLYESSDMVISKGQGNYEGLSNTQRRVFFLLVAKCPLVANNLHEPLGKLILKVKK